MASYFHVYLRNFRVNAPTVKVTASTNILKFSSILNTTCSAEGKCRQC